MANNFLKKHPKISTFILSSIIVFLFGFLLFKIITFDILQDFEGGEKYSIYDKIIYQIRCNQERNIRLRELKPNSNYLRTPKQNYETLENRQYHLDTDNNGFIKPAMVNKVPQVQIFFLGGSTTECEMVDPEFRFPYLSGRILQEKLNIKINSDNAAKSGNNSLHSIDILLNKLIPFNPDIVVMMHNINDLSALFYEGTYWNSNKVITPIACDKKNRDGFIKKDQWSLSEAWRNRILKDVNEQKRITEDFAQNLKIFISIAKAKNIVPVLMTQANRIENDPDFVNERGQEASKLYQKLYIKFNQTIRQIAKNENVLLIDLAKKIPADKKYIYDVVHFNKAGSVLVADEVAKNLENVVKKKVKNHRK
jgi:lysophospholipase L1-like esterase